MIKKLSSATLAVAVLFSTSCKPSSWEKEALNIAQVALPIAASVVTVVAPGVGPLAASLEGGIQILITSLQAATAKPDATTLAQVKASVDELQSQSAKLIADIQVKDPADAKRASELVALFAQSVDEIAALIEQNAAPVVTATRARMASPMVARTHRATGAKAKDIQARYKAILK